MIQKSALLSKSKGMHYFAKKKMKFCLILKRVFSVMHNELYQKLHKKGLKI